MFGSLNDPCPLFVDGHHRESRPAVPAEAASYDTCACEARGFPRPLADELRWLDWDGACILQAAGRTAIVGSKAEQGAFLADLPPDTTILLTFASVVALVELLDLGSEPPAPCAEAADLSTTELTDRLDAYTRDLFGQELGMYLGDLVGRRGGGLDPFVEAFLPYLPGVPREGGSRPKGVDEPEVLFPSLSDPCPCEPCGAHATHPQALPDVPWIVWHVCRCGARGFARRPGRPWLDWNDAVVVRALGRVAILGGDADRAMFWRQFGELDSPPAFWSVSGAWVAVRELIEGSRETGFHVRQAARTIPRDDLRRRVEALLRETEGIDLPELRRRRSRQRENVLAWFEEHLAPIRAVRPCGTVREVLDGPDDLLVAYTGHSEPSPMTLGRYRTELDGKSLMRWGVGMLELERYFEGQGADPYRRLMPFGGGGATDADHWIELLLPLVLDAT